jgi:circadian clock protein KaiC
MERAGQLKVVCMYPETQDLQAHLLTTQRLVDEHQPSRIAIDSLSALERVSSETGFREFLINLTSFIKKREIAGLYSATSTSLTGGQSVSEQHISTLTDSIILLRYIQRQQRMHRGLIVLKMRGSEHAKEIREFTIDSNGMHLGSALSGTPAVLGEESEEH